MAVHNYDSEGITFVDGWTSIKQKNYLKVNKMNEKTKKEIADSLQYIGMTQEEAEQKYENICNENGYELSDPLGLALYRSFVMQHRRSQKRPSNSGGDSLVKKCFGFFVGLEAPRDTLAWKRRKAKEEYNRDVDNALEKGIVAVATQNALGKWTVSAYRKGEYQEKVMTNLPPGAEEGNDGQYYIPLDDTERYMNGAENKNFGKPLAPEEYRRQGIFYGSVDGGEMEIRPFSYKRNPCLEFAPNTFEWVHFLAIPNENGNLYGMTDTTLNSLILNSSLSPDNSDYRDMSNFNVEDFLVDSLKENVVSLVDLDRKHMENLQKPYNQRFIVTDGVVCNMNMTPTSNGNRILNITDLNAEFDYEGNGVVTCWIPEHMEIDFGIGSSVIVIGNTSQRTVDGETEPATINASGLYVIERKGSVVEASPVEEEAYDWF